MINWYINLELTYQVLIASMITWFLTSLGSSLVFLFKKVNKNILDNMLGLSAGIMIAASFFSLLQVSVEKSIELGYNPFLLTCIGFLSGGILLFILDKLISLKVENKINIENKNSFKRNLLLVLSITLHNIPEGLAIGVAFGSIASGSGTLIGAFMLAVGIGIQNFPEGSAVSIPLRREGMSRTKAFLYGVLSGAVEPLSALIGVLVTIYINSALPFFLSLAAGAMIFVSVSELIPESQTNKNKNIVTLFTLLGFAIMMCLDVGLG